MISQEEECIMYDRIFREFLRHNFFRVRSSYIKT